MNEIIHVLPESIANQIAAGEVIQRPASVLKELVENALDAGATQIRIEVEEAGRALLRVTDNGCGMSPMDARMAFERHATSKIASVEDLFSLQSMGFRGEALASIASVAQVELTTRRPSDEMGTQITINGSEVVSVKTVAASEGSSFTIRNLFFNVPARRRFLKTNATELRHLQEQFERIVLIYPHISFSFYSDGNPLLDLPKTTLLRRIADTLGKNLEKGLIPIEFKNELITINGFVGKPDTAKKRNPEQYFFVNGRFMKHSYFHRAITSVYEQLLAPGMHPNYFIYFSVNPSRIDVNIHPTKTEIKFLDEQAIFKLLAIVVRQTISLNMATPTIEFDAQKVVDIPIYEGHLEENLPMPETTIDPNYNPFDDTSYYSLPTASTTTCSNSRPKIDWNDVMQSFAGSSESNKNIPQAEESDARLFPDIKQEQTWQTTEENDNAHSLSPLTNKESRSIIFGNRYIITTINRGVVFIDSRRAMERILYQQFVTDLQGEGSIMTSRLIAPMMCTFPPREEARISLLLPDLEELGFELSPLGGGNYSILSVPHTVASNAQEIAEQAIIAMLEKDNMGKEELIDLIATFQAHKQVNSLTPLITNEEAEKLTSQLFSCPNSSYTPTGKRIIKVFGAEELKDLFA